MLDGMGDGGGGGVERWMSGGGGRSSRAEEGVGWWSGGGWFGAVCKPHKVAREHVYVFFLLGGMVRRRVRTTQGGRGVVSATMLPVPPFPSVGRGAGRPP